MFSLVLLSRARKLMRCRVSKETVEERFASKDIDRPDMLVSSMPSPAYCLTISAWLCPPG